MPLENRSAFCSTLLCRRTNDEHHLEGQPYERISVTGDIVAMLRLPVGWSDRRFRIATSDGTLILGTYSDGEYQFEVEVEGAGIARPTRRGPDLDWAVEWIAISDIEDSGVAIRLPEPLPLFETV